RLLPDLPAVANNVAGLARALTDPVHGCVEAGDCQVLLDPVDTKTVSRALQTARERAEDMLLVYFAGHGVVGAYNGELYLALPGTEPDDPGFTALRYEDLRQALLGGDRVRAAVRVVIIDCCFSGRAIP